MADGPVVNERWLHIKALVVGALEQAPAAVPAWLDAQCGDDSELRREVESLIASHCADPEFMEAPAIAGPGVARAIADRVGPSVQSAMIGRRLGPYRLVAELGRGGMGVVYLAERDDQAFDRQVAIKMVCGAVLHPSLADRFDAERRILARFEHPNIARLLDAGTDPSGTPFAVMEYVRGTPIDEYVRNHRLSIPERLELFCAVCDAAQYSHERLVVHRDIKPRNVLVTEEGVPKLLDFGIAKLLDSSGGRTEQTRTDFRALTPETASPEQVRGDPITVASDVYSLGVLLFRLLTGASPYRATARTDVEMARAVCEEEPARPSDAVAEGDASLSPRGMAARRRELKGDLDWITVKALEKDPARRYGTAADLAADLRRHLSHRAVLAGPPSVMYRTWKFGRRHRFAVGAATALILLLAAFAVAMTLQARRIARERDRAAEEARAKEQVAGFLKELFKLSDPGRARGNAITAREILDAGVRKIDSTLAGQPALRADLLAETGDVYESLGLYNEAAGLKRRALALRRQALGPEHVKTLSDMEKLAALLDVRLGQSNESKALLTEALAVARRVLGEDHDETLVIESRLGQAMSGLRQYREAEKMLLDVIARRRRLSREDDSMTLVAMTSLSLVYLAQERYEESATLEAQIFTARQRTLGEDHPYTLMAMNNLAYSLMTLRRYDQSKAVLERAMVLGEKVWGTDHPQYAGLLQTRGELAAAMGDVRLAEAHLLRALASYQERGYGANRPMTLYELAQVSARLGKVQPALNFLAQALELGYRPAGSATVEDDPQLASLRADPRFRALLSAPRASAGKRP